MCHESATVYIQCLHTENQLTRCQTSYKSWGTKKKQSFIKTLFCVNIPQSCRPSKGQSSIDGLCTACSQAAKHRQETLDKMEQPRYVHSRTYEARNPTEEERRRSRGKGTFRCSKCISEGRHTSARNRHSNGGLCCANGPREWESSRGQAHRSITPENKNLPAAPTPIREHTLKRVPRNHHLRPSPSTQDARAAATAAAHKYNWTRDEGSDTMEPNLIGDYINMSGTETKEFRLPARAEPVYQEPRRARAEPLYQKPLIDWDRWNRAPQTSHGRYPPADPAPDSPLPTRPLRPGRRHPSPPRIQTPNPNPGRRLTPAPLRLSGDSSEVSPLSSRNNSQDWGRGTSRSPSPVSPLSCVSPERMYIRRNQHGHLRVETVDEQLEDTLRYWGN